MAWYSIGAVDVTNGSRAVAGIGTDWFSSLQRGWGFVGPDGRVYEIEDVSSATSLTLARDYEGSSVSAGSYSAFPTLSLSNDLATRLGTLISDYQGALNQIPNLLPRADVVGDVDNGGVMQHGSVGGRRFTRFADGLQICKGFVTVDSIDVATAGGGGYHSASEVQFVYPAAFVEKPSVAVQSEGGSRVWASTNIGNSFVGVSGMSFTSRNVPIDFSVMVVGYWK